MRNFENRLRFDKVTESLKVGTFFETQCSCKDVPVTVTADITALVGFQGRGLCLHI